MPRFVSPDGNLTIETAVPSEAAELRRDGFKEQKARTKAVQEAEAAQAADAADVAPVEPAAEAKPASRKK